MRDLALCKAQRNQHFGVFYSGKCRINDRDAEAFGQALSHSRHAEARKYDALRPIELNTLSSYYFVFPIDKQ